MRVAFASAAKRVAYGSDLQVWNLKKRAGRFKKILRMFKPPRRSFSFSLRRYLTRKIRQDMFNLHAESLQEIQRLSSSIDALREELRHVLGGQAQGPLAVGPGEILVRTAVGHVLCSASDHAVLADLLANGESERGTRLLIERILRPGDVFVDVGAHLGLHVLAAARAMQGRGKIIAFEPYAPTKRLLEKSVLISGFSEITHIHQAAVSNQRGRQKLFLGAVSGHHSLFPLEPSVGVQQPPIDVSVMELNDAIEPDERIDLFKVDAEGAEIEILESAEPFIKNNPNVALIVEYGPSHLKRRGQSTERWLSEFANLGLAYRVINPDTGALEEWPRDKLGSAFSVNLFFARPDSSVWANAEKVV